MAPPDGPAILRRTFLIGPGHSRAGSFGTNQGPLHNVGAFVIHDVCKRCDAQIQANSIDVQVDGQAEGKRGDFVHYDKIVLTLCRGNPAVQNCDGAIAKCQEVPDATQPCGRHILEIHGNIL